ncbi:MAG: NAD(P)/FAD-dependent oxidoreductase [Planctomycetota bacterium]
MAQESFDVVVIGSGISGLAAATKCACSGKSVLLLEGQRQFGGFINPFRRRGYSFDPGVHYLAGMGADQPLGREMEALGISPDTYMRELDPERFDDFVFPDYRVSMCRGKERFHARLEEDFPQEKDGLKEFFEILDCVDAAIDAQQSGKRDLASLGSLIYYKGANYSDLLDDCTTDLRLRAVLSGLVGDIGLAPSQTDAITFVALMTYLLRGTYFPKGGSGPWRDAFLDRLRTYGATLRKRSTVERIVVENDRAVGVITKDEREIRCKQVISCIDAKSTLRKLVGSAHLPPKLDYLLEDVVYGPGSLCVFLGLRRNPADWGLKDQNLWHFPSYDIDRDYERLANGELSGNIPFVVNSPSYKASAGKCDSKHTVYLCALAPWKKFMRWQHEPVLRRSDAYMKLKCELGESLIRQAERYLPGLSQEIEIREFSTPLTNRSYVSVPQGAIYSLADTPEQAGFYRRFSEIPLPGLHLAGSAVAGAGVHVCMQSGLKAADAALKA